MRQARAGSVLSVLLVATVLGPGLRAQGDTQGNADERVAELRLLEDYALAEDRAAVVARLLAGSEDWYDYSCREKQAAGDLRAVDELLAAWIERYGRTARAIAIENRQALLGFERDPAAAFAFLRRALGLRFDDQRTAGEPEAWPTRLDPALITWEAWAARARAQHASRLDGFHDSALFRLAGQELGGQALDGGALHELLGRLWRPDVPGLPALIVRDLRAQRGREFGSLPIHQALRLEHLAECQRLQPALLQDRAFVETVLERMRPDADSSWLREPVQRRLQLERLWDFAQHLPAVHNSLKAHLLHHLLRSDLEHGAPDRERFLAYVRLPGRRSHVPREYCERFDAPELVDAALACPTGLAEIGDDEPLLRACLEHFFASEDRIEPFAEYLDAEWLRTVLAETRLLGGDPDPARWYALLSDPARVEALARRVEIGFARTQRVEYAAEDPVMLEVDVKHVPTLLVKVFAIDSFRYHVEEQREVDQTIALDGLVANSEQTFRYEEAPLRRVRRRFELPELAHAGTFVVELIGNGISSRAVIRKGALHHVLETGAAGHVFTVFDEAGKHLRDAALWFGGREYAADGRGEIVVPFTTDPGEKRIVLRHGERSALASFTARAEDYELSAPWFLDREGLVAGERARLVVRPTLELAGRPVALRLLEEPVLTVIATDVDGLQTTREVRDLALEDERELVHELTVPERLARITVSLRGRVRDLAGEPLELESPADSIAVNEIDASEGTASAQLLLARDGYALEVRGKDGEPRAARALELTLAHRDFADPLQVTLQTDAAGRIELGALEGVTEVRFAAGAGALGRVELARAACAFPPALHGSAGETLRIPYPGERTAPDRAAFTLLAHDRDAFDRLALVGGFLELRDLSPGDYDLYLHETDTHVPVRVTRGRTAAGWRVGRERMLEDQRKPLQVREVLVEGDELRVRLTNASASTRVVLVATRYLPPFELFERLRERSVAPAGVVPIEAAPSTYHAGRALGAEYRYVLERRFAPKYPGNMLARPSLLLNPWDLDSGGHYGTGMPSSFASRRAGAGGRGGSGSGRGGGAMGSTLATTHPGIFANLDYLPRPSTTLANLTPDASGLVRVPLAELGDGQLVHVLALDGEQAVYDTLVRDERPLAPRERRLVASFDPAQHVLEQRRIEFLSAGGTAALDETRAPEVALLDSLAAVHRLFLTITHDEDLAQFEFVTRWPSLSRAEKLERYARFACHELHFFLHQKDRPFFDEVVRPFLANKLHKTFLDHWLLGDDLRGYLEPWAFGELDLIEQILLARRLGPEERESVARRAREAHELRPPDREHLRRLFELALSNEALDSKKGEVPRATRTKKGRQENEPSEKPGAGGAPASPGPGGAGATGPTSPGPAAPGATSKGELADSSGAAAAEEDLAERRAEDAERRPGVRVLYRPVEPTRRLVEHDYWHRVRMPGDGFAELVPANAFWRDYASAPPDQPFVSTAVAEASGSLLEMLFALAVLDLPFTPGEHELAGEGASRTLRAATPLILVLEESAPVAAAAPRPMLLLGESFVRLDDRVRLEGGEPVDKFVTDEFLRDVSYACQVVVTNPTSGRRSVELLLQIPAGAIPVQKGFWTRGKTVELEPFSTHALEYAFYFPRSGEYAHYPVHAAEKGEPAGAGEPIVLRVVDTPTRVDTSSWESVSQHGTAAEVLAHLEAANALGLDLARIAWRLRERPFFDALIARLRARHVWSEKVWSYGLLHEDARASREYLEHADAFLASSGAWLDSPLVRIDPFERWRYRHVELDPLVHARAHHSARLNLASGELARQYGAFLEVLGWRPRLDAEDWAMVTYYLLLQDRVQDALSAYAKIDPAELESRLQHDYLSAYLCFFTGDVRRARALAEPHREHPVAHWRERFADVLGQLDELEGKPAIAAGAGDQDRLAASEPSLELGGNDAELVVRHENLARCEVRYYPLDVEFAFSARPFAETDSRTGAWVQPLLRQSLELAAERSELVLPLPAQFRTSNVLVEVRAGGLSRSRTFFANALDVRTLEPYGQLAVADAEGSPLPATYVKVFARLPDGSVRFHKDGYTDLRGRFDYASVSDDRDLAAERYSVLILSERLGADIRELAPPAR